jgi:hypothetical protein
VQECGPEVLEVKRETFARLDAAAAKETILASSPPRSSRRNSPSARRRATLHRRASREPAASRPVVEVCGAPWTSAETKRRTIEIQRSVGQVPIDVKKEIDGFILNRLQVAFLTEAFRLVQEGYVSPEDSTTRSPTAWDCAGPSWARSRRSSSTPPAASPTTSKALRRRFRRYMAPIPPRAVGVGRSAQTGRRPSEALGTAAGTPRADPRRKDGLCATNG